KPYLSSKLILAAIASLLTATSTHAVIIDGGDLTYVSNTNGTLDVDAGNDAVTMDANGSSYYTFGANLSDTLSVMSAGESVTLTMDFNQTEGFGLFRVGLFNSGGTPLEDGSAFNASASNDAGIFVIVRQTSSDTTYETGTDGDMFFGSDRTTDTTNTGSYSNTLNGALSITYFLDESSNVNVTVALNGSDLYTTGFTTTGGMTFDTIAFVNDSSGSAAKSITFSNVSINAIPEASDFALWGGILCVGLLVRLRKARR
ncbi:MAG: hypothetical protein ACQKBW_11640, partial [Puniceicoccales bacterium]